MLSLYQKLKTPFMVPAFILYLVRPQSLRINEKNRQKIYLQTGLLK